MTFGVTSNGTGGHDGVLFGYGVESAQSAGQQALFNSYMTSQPAGLPGAAALTPGAELVPSTSLNEALSGLPFIGWLFGGTTNEMRDAAVDRAIAAGETPGYQGSQGGPTGRPDNPIGDVLGGTLGQAGGELSNMIGTLPLLGHRVELPFGQLGLLTPLLNVAFGQSSQSDAQIERNAIYNFGPRADAFEARGDAFGEGVAEGLRGTELHTPPEQRIPVFDDLMDEANFALGLVSDLNIPVVSYVSDIVRSIARGASGDAAFDWVGGNSSDPMDPSWTAFAAPVNVLVSGLARTVGPMFGLDQQAMDARFGRALGDAANVYDIFLPGDHTVHAWGSNLPRLFFGTPHSMSNHNHGHLQQFDVNGGSHAGH